MSPELKYIPWNPVEGLDGYFWFTSLIDDTESKYELVLKFRPEKSNRVFQVRFKNPLSYEKTSSFDFVNNGEGFHGVFLQLENSPFLNWFLYMSQDNYKQGAVKHYSFRTINFVIDVLTAHEVKAEWLD